MNPKLKFENLEEKKLIGKRTTMSFSDNKTPALWKSFMARRKEIQNAGGPDLFSVEIYPPFFFDNFDPTAQFEKWAAVEVTDFATVPKEMETLVLPSGLYAVFIHKGPAGDGPKTYNYIFTVWLPRSGYAIDARPHFALMGNKYKHDDMASEEEIWIPVKTSTKDAIA